jgi:rod shape-determining protein MreD
MRWLAYFILAYVLLGLQLGLGPFIAYRDVPPNLLILLVIFIALNAERNEAMLVCFLIGLAQDLTTLQPLGLFAFSYGIVAVLVCWLAESVRRAHPFTHFSLAFMATMVVGVILLAHQDSPPPPPSNRFASGRASWW